MKWIALIAVLAFWTAQSFAETGSRFTTTLEIDASLVMVGIALVALLLPFLYDHIRAPEFQCRFRWTPHAIAFWDNRSAQHLAVADYRERRVMHRVTLAGDKPF